MGHGHFDHTFDIPNIVAGTDLQVYAPGLTGALLKMRGVPSSRLSHAQNKEYLLDSFKVRAFRSSHVLFDRALVVSTLRRFSLKHFLPLCCLGLGYPHGLVQTYLFESGGKKVLFISSAGCSESELALYKKLEVDILLAPLQGHSDIQKIAARQTMIIQPKMVIPHHHDDFYPPLSQSVSVDVFKDQLEFMGFKGKFLEIPLFKEAQI